MDLGQKIKWLREEKRISERELSRALKWPVSKIDRIESGMDNITLDELNDICDVLAIDPMTVITTSFNAGTVEQSHVVKMGLKEAFELAAKKYPLTDEERKHFAGSEVGKIINKQLPVLIEQKANIDLNNYLITGSVGKGQFAEIPWISVFRRSITESATKGIYIVYLFTADLKGVYLSLNQGFTYFKDKYGTRVGRQEIKKVAHYLRHHCKTIPQDLSLKEIELKAEKMLGKGYIPGHITGKYYEIDHLPSSEVLANDLRNLMTVYEEVIGLINGRKVEEFYDYVLAVEDDLLLADEAYNEGVEESVAEYIADHQLTEIAYNPAPQEKKEVVKNNANRKVYPRDKNVASNALILANFECEVNPNHASFTSKTTHRKYMESHHLIPLEYHEQFEYSLDVEANVVSLCSHCHNCMHYGIKREREEMIEKLYAQRQKSLQSARISITLDDLKKMY